MSNLVLKYSAGNTPGKSLFHSSGLANAQNSSNMGTTSTQSFSARQNIENNRSFIGSYKNSQIASDYSKKTAETNRLQSKDTNSSNSSLTSKYKTWYNGGDSGGISSDG